MSLTAGLSQEAVSPLDRGIDITGEHRVERFIGKLTIVIGSNIHYFYLTLRNSLSKTDSFEVTRNIKYIENQQL